MADNTAPVIPFMTPPDAAVPAARPVLPPQLPPAFIAKLSRVLGKIHRVPKRGRNEFHRYDYATEADIMAAVRLPLAEEGLFIVPNLDHKDVVPWDLGGGKGPQFKTTVFMTFYLCDSETGAYLPERFQGEGIDNLDKGLAKAITAATKYFLKTTFLIATGDDPEADAQLDALAQAPAAAKKTGTASTAKTAAQNGAAKTAPVPTGAPTDAADTAHDEPTPDQLNQLAELMKARGLNKAALQALMAREFAWSVESARDLDREQFTMLLQWFATH